jgi:FixJ family two-component response regulator
VVGKFNNDEKTKDIPFMLLSGHQDIKRLAGVMGAGSYLEKPFSLAALYKSIEEALCYKKD